MQYTTKVKIFIFLRNSHGIWNFPILKLGLKNIMIVTVNNIQLRIELVDLRSCTNGTNDNDIS